MISFATAGQSSVIAIWRRICVDVDSARVLHGRCRGRLRYFDRAVRGSYCFFPLCKRSHYRQFTAYTTIDALLARFDEDSAEESSTFARPIRFKQRQLQGAW